MLYINGRQLYVAFEILIWEYYFIYFMNKWPWGEVKNYKMF